MPLFEDYYRYVTDCDNRLLRGIYTRQDILYFKDQCEKLRMDVEALTPPPKPAEDEKAEPAKEAAAEPPKEEHAKD